MGKLILIGLCLLSVACTKSYVPYIYTDDPNEPGTELVEPAWGAPAAYGSREECEESLYVALVEEQEKFDNGEISSPPKRGACKLRRTGIDF